MLKAVSGTASHEYKALRAIQCSCHAALQRDASVTAGVTTEILRMLNAAATKPLTQALPLSAAAAGVEALLLENNVHELLEAEPAALAGYAAIFEGVKAGLLSAQRAGMLVGDDPTVHVASVSPAAASAVLADLPSMSAIAAAARACTALDIAGAGQALRVNLAIAPDEDVAVARADFHLHAGDMLDGLAQLLHVLCAARSIAAPGARPSDATPVVGSAAPLSHARDLWTLLLLAGTRLPRSAAQVAWAHSAGPHLALLQAMPAAALVDILELAGSRRLAPTVKQWGDIQAAKQRSLPKHGTAVIVRVQHVLEEAAKTLTAPLQRCAQASRAPDKHRPRHAAPQLSKAPGSAWQAATVATPDEALAVLEALCVQPTHVASSLHPLAANAAAALLAVLPDPRDALESKQAAGPTPRSTQPALSPPMSVHQPARRRALSWISAVAPSTVRSHQPPPAHGQPAPGAYVASSGSSSHGSTSAAQSSAREAIQPAWLARAAAVASKLGAIPPSQRQELAKRLGVQLHKAAMSPVPQLPHGCLMLARGVTELLRSPAAKDGAPWMIPLLAAACNATLAAAQAGGSHADIAGATALLLSACGKHGLTHGALATWAMRSLGQGLAQREPWAAHDVADILSANLRAGLQLDVGASAALAEHLPAWLSQLPAPGSAAAASAPAAHPAAHMRAAGGWAHGHATAAHVAVRRLGTASGAEFASTGLALSKISNALAMWGAWRADMLPAWRALLQTLSGHVAAAAPDEHGEASTAQDQLADAVDLGGYIALPHWGEYAWHLPGARTAMASYQPVMTQAGLRMLHRTRAAAFTAAEDPEQPAAAQAVSLLAECFPRSLWQAARGATGLLTTATVMPELSQHGPLAAAARAEVGAADPARVWFDGEVFVVERLGESAEARVPVTAELGHQSNSESQDAELRALTVPMLKDLLRSAGLKVSGRKDVLVERLLEHGAGQSASSTGTQPAARSSAPAVLPDHTVVLQAKLHTSASSAPHTALPPALAQQLPPSARQSIGECTAMFSSAVPLALSGALSSIAVDAFIPQHKAALWIANVQPARDITSLLRPTQRALRQLDATAGLCKKDQDLPIEAAVVHAQAMPLLVSKQLWRLHTGSGSAATTTAAAQRNHEVPLLSAKARALAQQGTTLHALSPHAKLSQQVAAIARK